MRRLKHHYPIWLLCLLAAVTAASASAQTLPTLDISELQYEAFEQSAEFLIAPAHYALEDVRNAEFQAVRKHEINRGITGQTYWLRARLHNTAALPKAWVLHHETSYLDNMTVYVTDGLGDVTAPAETTRIRLSDRRPFTERPIPYRKLAIAHKTPAGGYTDLYVKINFDAADSLTLRFDLWDRERFHDAQARQNLVHGAYFGIMLTLMVITLISAIVLQKTIYVYYLAFLITSAIMWALINGYAFQYLWPGSVFWHNEGFHIVYLLFSIAALQFSKAFLKTQRTFPRIHVLLGVLQLVMVGGILLRFYGLYVPILALSFASLSLLALLPVLGWMAYRRGLRYARWYALAWLVYALGLVLCVLSAATSLFNWGMEPLAFAQGASLLEAVLLLAALAERLRVLDLDRQQALALANQDPLTGLGNRRQLAQSLTVFRARFAQSGLPVYLLMIDLDHFKKINDRHGHEAGDAVLYAFAQMLKRLSRTQDVCVRYGGEEFAILFQAPELDIAVQIAERIRTEFAQTPTFYDGHLIPHTLSSGLTRIISDEEQLSTREMMQRADAALYDAKAQGRNRTTVYTPADRSTPSETLLSEAD